MMSKLHVLALYGAKDVCFCISDKNNFARRDQMIRLPRTPENIAFAEKAVTACNAHDQMVAALLHAESALHARLPNSTAMVEVLAALKLVGIDPPQHKTGKLTAA